MSNLEGIDISKVKELRRVVAAGYTIMTLTRHYSKEYKYILYNGDVAIAQFKDRELCEIARNAIIDSIAKELLK